MGRAIVAGGARATAPISGILAETLAVGSSIYINEVGTPIEYLIVNSGIPSNSSQYDNSCNGLWVLRRDILESRSWHTEFGARYKASDIHAYLNSTFLDLFDDNTKQIISQVKIPYINSSGSLASGSSGLDAQAFLLSGYEVGFTTSDTTNQSLSEEGAKLSYFESGTTTTANSKRIAKMNDEATSWHLRSPCAGKSDYNFFIDATGGTTFNLITGNRGVRPCLILPFNAYFDKDTLLLKGVA